VLPWAGIIQRLRGTPSFHTASTARGSVFVDPRRQACSDAGARGGYAEKAFKPATDNPIFMGVIKHLRKKLRSNYVMNFFLICVLCDLSITALRILVLEE
jgi:hypothetical protein